MLHVFALFVRRFGDHVNNIQMRLLPVSLTTARAAGVLAPCHGELGAQVATDMRTKGDSQ